MEFKHLGHKSFEASKELDTFPKPKDVTLIKFDCFELTSFCPITEQPDFSTVTIQYSPKETCLESKSLKLYLWSFRDEGIFAEGLASQIANDIFSAINPNWIEVILTQNTRGGMQLSVTSRRES